MTDFTIHTLETAPAASRPLLAAAHKNLGFVPNLFGAFAASPTALGAYLDVGKHFDASDFTPTERQVVLMTANFENDCEYCMAAHSTIADMQQVDSNVVEALRSGATLADAKLQALRDFTRVMLVSRGRPTPDQLAAFTAAGYTERHVLEVIVGLAMKTLSNYTNHVVDTPVDDAFATRAWSKPEAAGV